LAGRFHFHLRLFEAEPNDHLLCSDSGGVCDGYTKLLQMGNIPEVNRQIGIEVLILIIDPSHQTIVVTVARDFGILRNVQAQRLECRMAL